MMSDFYPLVDQDFVDRFNTALTALGSSASIAVTTLPTDGTVFELLDDESDFLILVPSNATPEIVSLTYRLYEIGVRQGRCAGEALAWSKLRSLIGAAECGPQSPP
ncbi:MAG: hypothetical protein U0S50_14485 [Sphingopyxis sp.]|jgi:hypothetical protein|nr:hypothetical protein [Sphingopyxis sp.]MDZ3833005.1 hypothetical protein [Sphingopyxis sp.]HEX2813201.1 hypothetical protein [Sphingopyxis sp.]